MSADLVERIFEAICGHTPEDPQNLVGILGFVDGREKLVLTHEELSGALRQLLAAGRIRESSPHHYYEPDESGDPSSFSGLTPEEHEDACRRYQEEFRRKYRGLSRD